MPNIMILGDLNDYHESQNILTKLPNGLVSSWNRKVMENRQANSGFKELVDFLSKGADLACDPISSTQAIMKIESERPGNNTQHKMKMKQGWDHHFPVEMCANVILYMCVTIMQRSHSTYRSKCLVNTICQSCYSCWRSCHTNDGGGQNNMLRMCSKYTAH